MKSKGVLTKKILIVDDDPDILEAIGLILSSRGYTSVAVSNGSDVITTAKKYMPDVILLDVLLSGQDGRIICKDLKNDSITRNIPVVMISAHPSAERTSAEAGADGFIPKPFSIDFLIKSVERYA